MSNPAEILTSVQEFQRDHPDPLRTAFLIMQFGSTPAHEAITDAARRVFSLQGITVLRADDCVYHDDLYLNILTYVHGCGFGIAIFERIESDSFNPNVSFEVGYMMALGKPVCILKDRTIRTMPSDLMGKLYINFDPQLPLDTLKPEIPRWLQSKKLIRTPYRCSITIGQSIFGWDPDTLHQIASGIGALVPNVEPRFLGIRKTPGDQQAVIDFEADDRFFSRLQQMKDSGELERLAGIQIIDVCGERMEEVLPEITFLVQDLKAAEGRCVAQTCMLSSLKGWEEEAEEAFRVLPKRITVGLNECCIYITKRKGLYYCHSTYLRPGFLYPTKVLVKDMDGLRNVLPLVTGRAPGDLYKDERLVVAHVMHVRYLINKKTCANTGSAEFGLDGATRVEYVEV